MKKLISSLMVLAVVVLLVVSCNNGGKSSSVDYVKPAWAVQGVYPIAVHGENGDLIGYLAGVDNVDGCITIYNPDMDKFFKMSTDTGTIRGWRFGKTYRNCADENCNFYTYKRFSKFIYVNDVNTDWPRVSSGKFATVSDNPADAKSPSELKYWPELKYLPESTIELTCEDRIQEYQCGTELDGITPIMCQDVYTSLLSDDFYAYWSQHPDFKYYPFIEYTESFPFVYPAGQLTFTMD